MNRMEGYLRQVQALIDAHGWAVQTVQTQPPFFYTVGLAQRHRLPELVVCGLPVDTAQRLLNDLAQRLLRGDLVLAPGTLVPEVFTQYPAKFRFLGPDAVQRHLKVACALSEQTPQAWQLLWPDPDGRFEGDTGVDVRMVKAQDLDLVNPG